MTGTVTLPADLFTAWQRKLESVYEHVHSQQVAVHAPERSESLGALAEVIGGLRAAAAAAGKR